MNGNNALLVSDRAACWAGIGYILLNIVLFVAVLFSTGGDFTYSLDDAYIHLAMAENLPGFWGVNGAAAPPAMASSSILYPWLLMPLAHTPLAFLAPYIVNVLAGFAAILVLVDIERRINFWPQATPLIRACFVLAFAAITNLITLVFTGMEHSLHYLAALVIFASLLKLNQEKSISKIFWLAVIMAPLIRYEGLALSLLALLYVGLSGYWRATLVAGALVLAGPLLFGFYLHSMGLPWLPSSVLAKSASVTLVLQDTSAYGPVLLTFVSNILTNLGVPTGWAHLGQLILLSGLLCGPRVDRSRRLLGLVVLFTGAAHMFLGKFGWFDRYHAYTLALNLLAIIYCGQPYWYAWAQRMKNGHLLLVLLLLASGISSLSCMIQTPAAARQIRLVYGTLHDFVVTSWQDKVAAYDIGLLAWHNDYAVLDLYGLASEEIRRMIRHPAAMFMVPEYMRHHNYDLLISGEDAVRLFPKTGWQLVAVLHVTGKQIVTTLSPHIYAANPLRAAELRSKLELFKAQIPAGTELEIINDPK